MKKVLSVLLSVLMAFSACTATAATAMAAVISPGGGTTVIEIDGTVNSKVSVDVVFEQDPNDSLKIKFTYTGNDILIDWSFTPEDVTVLEKKDNYVIIKVKPSTDKVIANAIVEKRSVPIDPSNPVIPEDTTAPEETTKPSKSDSTSPATGALTTTGLAAAGAGIAVLSLLKKKNDAE